MEVISEKADINKTRRPMDKQSRVETRETKKEIKRSTKARKSID